ncbi:MAG TPA: CAP domain-containing protein [Casimicrobiaceae bacterium]|nr:CAP domain-containing protein [Casimicrobiaceae bacterium]
MTLHSLWIDRFGFVWQCAARLPIVVALFAGAAWSQEAHLGEAPRREESQDRGNWVHPFIPKAAKTRTQVVQLYQNVLVPGNSVALAWNGNVTGCTAGTTNVAHQQAVIDRVNYYRALVDLPAVTLSSGVATTQVQAAALMMSAHNALSHAPPTNWTCYSAEGAAGAAAANIFLGRVGVLAIDGYVDDFGPTNTAVGHRRWILFPPRSAMTTGDVPGGNAPPRPANALHVFGATTARPATPDGIAWPPGGFVPYQSLPALSNRWSFSYPGADFTSALVTMSGPSGAIPVTLETVATGFGDNTIVFLPTGVSYAKPSADTTYNVTVSNVRGAGVPPSFSYGVKVIDPDAPVPVPSTATAIEYYNMSLDHYFITHIANEIALLDAGTTIRGWTRTGESFKVYTGSGSDTSPVCRMYIPPAKGDSHFYGRGTTECTNTANANPTFINEDSQFFYVVLPTSGNCPSGLIAVHRVFSKRIDANHRYMIRTALRDLMVSRGWEAEGDGPNLVVMCVPQ